MSKTQHWKQVFLFHFFEIFNQERFPCHYLWVNISVTNSKIDMSLLFFYASVNKRYVWRTTKRINDNCTKMMCSLKNVLSLILQYRAYHINVTFTENTRAIFWFPVFNFILKASSFLWVHIHQVVYPILLVQGTKYYPYRVISILLGIW